MMKQFAAYFFGYFYFFGFWFKKVRVFLLQTKGSPVSRKRGIGKF